MKLAALTARDMCRFLTPMILSVSCAAFVPRASGDAAVLRWNGPAAGTFLWNATELAWLDSGEHAVAWVPNAAAAFESAGGGLVQIEEDVVASNLTFTGNGYTLLGAGLLKVEGAASVADATASRIDADLVSTAGFAKTGAGTLTLGGPNATLKKPVAVSQGALALQAATIPGGVSVAASATLSALPPVTNGLMGFYYNVTPTNYFFSTLACLEACLARLTPALAVASSAAGPAFDFGVGGALFPLPYGLGGSRTNNFEVVWRGVLTVPSDSCYTFRLVSDDGFLLAIDRQMVMNMLSSGTKDGTVWLAAGPHDMVLGYYQGGGTSGLQVKVKSLYGDFETLPNAWLTPYTSVGALSGSGALSLSAGNTAFNVTPGGASFFRGALSGPEGSLFSKKDSFNLTLTSASTTSNAFAGDLAVRGGILTLATGERLGDASTVSLSREAALRLVSDETLGALSGAGTVAFGGSPSVTVTPFSGDADSGLSPSKTYTHLLDFPADSGTPATINGVTFIAAGLSGSTNGYSWSTVNPPTGAWTNGFTTGVSQLLFDFAYGSTDYTLTLSGLHPGQTYETRLYFKGCGDANSTRKVTFAFTAGAVFVGSVDYVIESATRSIVGCRYTADAAGTLAIHVLSHHSIDTCHLYGLSNEEAAAPSLPEPAPTVSPCVVAFNDDADSGISTLKTYTHKLDFPLTATPATVNGVSFTAAGMNGSADGYDWSTTGFTPNQTYGDGSGAGVSNLLYDFSYNSTNFTLTLSGLYPGQTYETRLYFRSFGPPVPDSPRDVTFTFTAGATALGTVNHDLDTLARSMIRCRFTADTAGSLSVQVVSPDSGHTCHLYGLSNEQVQDGTSLPTLTFNSPAGSVARHTGALAGRGRLVKQGEGTQILGGANSLASPVEVKAGTLAFEPGAAVLSGVVVRAGATAAVPNGNVWLGGLEGAGTFSLAGVAPYPVTNMLYMAFFTNDLSTGISAAKSYTHKIDFGTRSSPATVINGVTFDKVQTANGAINGYGWTNFPAGSHAGNAPSGVPTDSGIYNLLYDMDYGLSYPDPATMQLTGLTPGKRYEVRFYNRVWGAGNRTQTLTFDPDGPGPIREVITFNPDGLAPNFVAYRYTATSSPLNITVQSALFNMTYHIYGFSNEEVQDAVYVPVTVDVTRDSLFSGPVTGAGSWVKTGAGTLTLAGESDAVGALSVSAGALAVANGGCATLGPVTVAEGASLFGEGRVGGNVTLASNAVIRAGMPSACGTLAVGGDLALVPGARPAFRFNAGGEHDTITVGGLLTFPSHGVVEAAALAENVPPPTKALFFDSAQRINGPESLAGWKVQGVENVTLKYSDDRTKIYFFSPRGTLILVN